MDDQSDTKAATFLIPAEERAQIEKDLELRQRLRDEFCGGRYEEDEPEYGHPRETLTMYR
jgi:hypothetical protein